MKYLLLIQLSSGTWNATIFDSLEEAKSQLHEIASDMKYPITIDWKGDECFLAKPTPSDWIKAQIIKAERAEYRLVKHTPGEEDEERRFFIRENAVSFVKENYDDASPAENSLGEWTKNSKNHSIYKLYAVVLEPEKGSSKVIQRFNAATSRNFIFGSIDEIETDDKKESVVIEKKPESFLKHTSKKFNLKGRKKIYAIIALIAIVAIGINVITTDWQLVADERKASSFYASEEIKSISNSLSLTRKGRAVFFASQPKLLGSTAFNKTCGKDGSSTFTSGCYYKDASNNEHIEIFNVGTSTINENGLTYNFAEYRKSVTLHETLHAVWERFDSNKQSSTCKDLKTLSNQISDLKQEVSFYDNSHLCTELFARVGSEYIPILSPNNNISSSANIPVKYSSLDSSGKTAVTNLVKIYDEYFDTTKYTWVINYWQSENQLKSFEKKVLNYINAVNQKEQSTRTLINQYYYWPTWARYYNALNAINEYNDMVKTLNSYVATYNKVISILDSEQTMSAGTYLDF